MNFYKFYKFLKIHVFLRILNMEVMNSQSMVYRDPSLFLYVTESCSLLELFKMPINHDSHLDLTLRQWTTL